MSMDPRMRPAPTRQYEEFEPETSLSSEDGAETLLVHLPGFKKEQLRVQLTQSRTLKISGERLLGANKWQRFMKEVKVPATCDAKEITAKFEGGVLYVRQPKLIIPAEPSPAPAPVPDPVPAPSPAPAPAPAPGPAEKQEDVKEGKGKEVEESEPRADDTRNKNEHENAVKKEIERKAERVAEKLRSGEGIFKSLKKPENVKLLVVMVAVAIALALHIAYINKTCRN